jgi:hypothetical protein
MENDSRWAPYRRQQLALKEDCPRGIHEPRLWRGGPGYAEYRCVNCEVAVSPDGKAISPFGRDAPVKELKVEDLKLLGPSLRCEKHPRYQGKRRPRAICETCHYIWEKNQR